MLYSNPEQNLYMRILSYNLRKNHASGELFALAEDFNIDVLCVQECDTTSLPADIGVLHLADSTKRNRLGLAIYYNSDRFSAETTAAFELKKSLHDRVLTPAHERLIAAKLIDVKDGREFTVASFHAAPLTASNSLRRKQISAAYERLSSLGGGIPTLMVGDYNYPIFKKNLTAHVGESGYDLTLSDHRTYTRYKIFRGHYDFVTSSGLNVGSVETLRSGDSDHKPILVSAQYTAAAV